MAGDSKRAEKASLSRAGNGALGDLSTRLGMELIRIVGGAMDAHPFVVATK